MIFFLLYFLLSCRFAFSWIDLEALYCPKNIITSLKKIEFKEFPNAYNPSLLPIESGFLLVFRYNPDPENQSWLSYIGVAELNLSLEPTSQPILLNTRRKNSRTFSQAEDARLFTYRNRLFLIYNDNLTVHAPYYQDRRDIFIAELSKINGTYELSVPLKLYYEPEYTYCLWQKNWTPFEYQGQLLLSYSLNPHLIIYPNLITGACYPYYETSGTIDWPFGILRGSSSAVLVDGEYWSFFHSSIWTGSKVSPGQEIWHYFMGAYAFASTPPFKITRITQKPIIAEEFYTLTHREKRVIFPGGFAVLGESIYVAYGKDDCEMWIATLDKQELKKAMISIH